jgi:hypothetical protein
VDVIEPHLAEEGQQEPGPDDPVVDDLAVSGKSSGGRGRGFDHRRVLLVRERQPRRDCAATEKAEDVVARDQRTSIELICKQRSNCRCARTGRAVTTISSPTVIHSGLDNRHPRDTPP